MISKLSRLIPKAVQSNAWIIIDTTWVLILVFPSLSQNQSHLSPPKKNFFEFILNNLECILNFNINKINLNNSKSSRVTIMGTQQGQFKWTKVKAERN